MKFILQCLLVAVLGLLSYLYYGLVLPQIVAAIIAVVIAGVACLAMISKHLEFKLALFGGAAIAVWPAGALLIQGVGHLAGYAVPAAICRSGAILAAAGAAQVSFALAEKRDRARDVGCLSLGAISLFTIIYSLFSGSRIAVAVACLGVAVVGFIARQQMILPPAQENQLQWAVRIATVAAGINAMLAFL